MKDFLGWVKDKNLTVEVPTPAEGEEVKQEDARKNISANYPDAYKRAQYPHKYFNPVNPKTDYDLEAKAKTPPDNAP